MGAGNDTILLKVKKGELPSHLAIIMDGNGRWAARRKLLRVEGHKAGATAVDKIIQASIQIGIPVLSLYAFSTENWKRPETEVNALFELLNFYLKRKAKSLIKNGISLRVSGDISKLPLKSRKLLNETITNTSSLNKLILNLCINYGSRDELLIAVEKLIKKRIVLGDIKKISSLPEWNEIEENLYTNGLPDIDLLIRTAGEKRLSNFMLLQSAYAELYFTDIEWPDFGESELLKALIEYQRRTRKFGGLVEESKTGK
ncbi:MAG: polyprenyl diphosphate synthase [Spirochaetia bacterium]|nr:polyprenyl diphosphate synthase [Spirochaetia bacterium]